MSSDISFLLLRGAVATSPPGTLNVYVLSIPYFDDLLQESITDDSHPVGPQSGRQNHSEYVSNYPSVVVFAHLMGRGPICSAIRVTRPFSASVQNSNSRHHTCSSISVVGSTIRNRLPLDPETASFFRSSSRIKREQKKRTETKNPISH